MTDPRTASTRRSRRWGRALVAGAVTASLGATAAVGVLASTAAPSNGARSSSSAGSQATGSTTSLGSGSTGSTHATSSGS